MVLRADFVSLSIRVLEGVLRSHTKALSMANISAEKVEQIFGANNSRKKNFLYFIRNFNFSNKQKKFPEI